VRLVFSCFLVSIRPFVCICRLYFSAMATVQYHPYFKVKDDCATLKAAVDGYVFDGGKVNEILAYRSNRQRQQLKRQFMESYKVDLVEKVKVAVNIHINYLSVVQALMMRPLEYDVHVLYKAFRHGNFVDKEAVIEILASRDNERLRQINEEYPKASGGKSVAEEIKRKTSGAFQVILAALNEARRAENSEVDENEALCDATMLYEVGMKQLEEHTAMLVRILVLKSCEHVSAVRFHYRQLTKSKTTLTEAFRDNLGEGDFVSVLTAVVQCAHDPPGYFARKLYKSMKGLGTTDTMLIRVVVSRCEVDMLCVKSRFKDLYGSTLEKWIRDDTSGDYRSILVDLVSTRD